MTRETEMRHPIDLEERKVWGKKKAKFNASSSQRKKTKGAQPIAWGARRRELAFTHLSVAGLASGVWYSRVGILFASLMKWPLIGLLPDRAHISFCFKSWFTSSPSQWGYHDYSKSSPSYSQVPRLLISLFPSYPFLFHRTYYLWPYSISLLLLT